MQHQGAHFVFEMKCSSIVAKAAWKVVGGASVRSLCCLEKVQLNIISDGQWHQASAAMIIVVLIAEVSTINSGNW